MFPKVACFHFAFDTESAQRNIERLGVFVTVEESDNVISVGHLTVPYVAAVAVEHIAKRLSYKAVGIESKKLVVGVETEVVAYGAVLVSHCDRAARHEL